jgi:hypothetical protein
MSNPNTVLSSPNLKPQELLGSNHLPGHVTGLSPDDLGASFDDAAFAGLDDHTIDGLPVGLDVSISNPGDYFTSEQEVPVGAFRDEFEPGAQGSIEPNSSVRLRLVIGEAAVTVTVESAEDAEEAPSNTSLGASGLGTELLGLLAGTQSGSDGENKQSAAQDRAEQDDSELNLSIEDDEPEVPRVVQLPPDERLREMIDSPGAEHVINFVTAVQQEKTKPNTKAIKRMKAYIKENAIQVIAQETSVKEDLVRQVWTGLAANDRHLTPSYIVGISTLRSRDGEVTNVNQDIRNLMLRMAVEVNTYKAIDQIRNMTEDRLKELRSKQNLEGFNQAQSDKNLLPGSELGFNFAPTTKLILSLKQEVLEKQESPLNEASVLEAVADRLAEAELEELQKIAAQQEEQGGGDLEIAA